MSTRLAGALTRPRANALRVDGRERVEANARLTAMTAVSLLVLFSVEVATVLLTARSMLSLHVAVGLILVPPVLLKIGSVTWRMASYYRGKAAYREKGPPPLALRILGPLLVFLTKIVLVSGIGLIALPHHLHYIFFTIHAASFYLWIAVLVIHVAAHFKRTVRLTARDVLRRTRIRAGRARLRTLTVGGALVLGACLALAFTHTAETYLYIYPHK